MTASEPVVYIVHCVDAEGPLDESLEATFDRIRDIFGINLEPSVSTLEKLQAGAFDLGEYTKPLQKMLDPKLLNYHRSWHHIDRMLDRICAPDFRNIFPDAYGTGWVFSWFCVDHTGYIANPRNRDLGHHRIFDHYRKLCDHAENAADRVFFHYHPLPYNRLAHSCATNYVSSNHIWKILSRKIIERSWFPSVFRPGFHVTRPDSHWFLEQWIPFDYANQAVDIKEDQPDLQSGRFGDWRRAPKFWGAYHPSHDDYQLQGNCRRWILRCLNMEARLRPLTMDHVHAAFYQAKTSGSAVLAFTNHDFRDMLGEIEKVRGFIIEASSQHPGVRFAYVDALTAARLHLGIHNIPDLGLEAQLSIVKNGSSLLEVSVHNKIFGPQPFLAVQDASGNFYWDNFDRSEDSMKWRYIFDWQTFSPEQLATVGIAVTGAEGQIEVINLDPISSMMIKTRINYD